MGYKFPKENRLLNSSDYNYLRRGASVANSPWARAYYKLSVKSAQNGRLGISVTKKVGKANVRNYLKRLTREYYRSNNFSSLGYDVVLTVSPRLTKKFEDKEEFGAQYLKSLDQIFSRISQCSGN